MPPRRKAPAAKAKASKAASPPAAGVDKKFALPQQQQQQTEPSTVATLFNRAQEAGTAAAAKRLADLLWSAWARQANDGGETGEGAFWIELERCVSHLLVNATQVRMARARERERQGMRESRLFVVGVELEEKGLAGRASLSHSLRVQLELPVS